MSGHVLDLARYAWYKPVGDLVIYGTWIGPSIDDSEPCLAIVPARRQSVGTVKPAVVALSAAYRYDDPRYLLRAAMRFCEGFGWTDSMFNVRKIADAIYDHLDDLVALPERPSFGSRVGAEATITDESGRSTTVEILDHQ